MCNTPNMHKIRTIIRHQKTVTTNWIRPVSEDKQSYVNHIIKPWTQPPPLVVVVVVVVVTWTTWLMAERMTRRKRRKLLLTNWGETWWHHQKPVCWHHLSERWHHLNTFSHMINNRSVCFYRLRSWSKMFTAPSNQSRVTLSNQRAGGSVTCKSKTSNMKLHVFTDWGDTGADPVCFTQWHKHNISSFYWKSMQSKLQKRIRPWTEVW